MLDPQRKLNAFSTRANYQLREIQHTCREVVTMSKVLNTLSLQISSSEVNCKKIEFFKGEIKDKLKEFAGSVDEVYKIIDRKVQLILLQLNKQKGKIEKPMKSICTKCNAQIKKMQQSEKYPAPDTERIFSDTLNPRITHLQSKVHELQANEVKLKNKITDLTNKNQALVEEFNRLSTASNKKINELTSRISKDSFSLELENLHQSPTKSINKQMEQLTFSKNNMKQKRFSSPHFEEDQFSHKGSNEPSFVLDMPKTEEKRGFLNFGCMPSQAFKKSSNILERSDSSQEHQRLDRNDRNRRFDLLLNKLRNSQQESTEGSHSQELRPSGQQMGSVFSQNIVQRYQI